MGVIYEGNGLGKRLQYHLVRADAEAIRSVDATNNLQPLAFAGVDHVEGGASLDVDDVSHLKPPLHHVILVNPADPRLPCPY